MWPPGRTRGLRLTYRRLTARLEGRLPVEFDFLAPSGLLESQPMTARSVAVSRIARAARRFPEIDFRSEDDAADTLDARDAALASAIEQHVLRRWMTLVAILEKHLSRPWEETEARVQAALLCGAAQLLLMDRLPDYAVIDETVEWTKSNVRPNAGGLINAVLRKVASLRSQDHGEQKGGQSRIPLEVNELPLHDGRVLELNEAVFAADQLLRLSQQTSHPLALLEHWIGIFGFERASQLASHDLVHAPIIMHGISAEIAGKNEFAPHQQAGFFARAAHGHAPLQEMMLNNPDAIVQDPTAASAVQATRDLEPAPRLIIDACAGRGTKTKQLAQAHPTATIIATDTDGERMRSLRRTFAKVDRVRCIDHARLIDYSGKADLVLLDVPCSNTGVLARRVEAKYRFNRASLRGLVDMQRQIIADALRLVGDRGRVLYATCSIDPTENEQQTQWVAQWHPFDIVAQKAQEPKGMPGENVATYHDGGYWALLRKKA